MFIRQVPIYAQSGPSVLACMALLLLNLLQNLIEVVARRILHWRERHIGFELFQPQHLADRQDVPIVKIASTWCCQRTAQTQKAFAIRPNSDLEGITHDVGDLSPVEGDSTHQSVHRT